MTETNPEFSNISLNRRLDKVDGQYLDFLWQRLHTFIKSHLTESISLAQVERLTGIPATTLAPIVYLELRQPGSYRKFVTGIEDFVYLDLQGKIDNFPNCRTILQRGTLKEAFRLHSAQEETVLIIPKQHGAPPRLIGSGQY